MRVRREDLRVPDAEADLYLVGLGIGGLERRTVEADEVLHSAGVILHHTAFDADLRHMYQAEVVDLEPVYADGPNPLQAYRNMAAQVLQAVRDGDGKSPVCFLTYGHPLYLVESAWILMEEAGVEGISVKPLPSASFLDAVLVDLGARFDFGVQVYDASVFYSHDIEPDIRFPVILAQFGSFDIRRLRQSGDLYGRISPLTHRLQDIYPPDRAVAAVLSSWRPDMAPQISRTTIRDLDSLISSSHSGTTLFIGGSEPWANVQQDWMKLR
ncbi:SAM-dependent methyltransferase [Streptomyces formicae]|uniref:Tetrapyrrole methylase domain-containing protein n=1 Tax=Streptomyces formicae TaxID=1616117 RepID=A0A291QI21_9ACTN|nr:SAM-dependent methyltransferase [Streptomyces formicae]ATL31167.1 hypothetical protein KY5_6149 [Streptomyces formicae]